MRPLRQPKGPYSLRCEFRQRQPPFHRCDQPGYRDEFPLPAALASVARSAPAAPGSWAVIEGRLERESHELAPDRTHGNPFPIQNGPIPRSRPRVPRPWGRRPRPGRLTIPYGVAPETPLRRVRMPSRSAAEFPSLFRYAGSPVRNALTLHVATD